MITHCNLHDIVIVLSVIDYFDRKSSTFTKRVV